MSEASLAQARGFLRSIWDDSPAPEPNLIRRVHKGEGKPRVVGPVLGIFAIGVLLAGLVLQLPSPALYGEGLVAFLGLFAVAGVLFVEFAFNPGSIRWVMVMALGIALGSAAVAAVQTGGTAVIGCYVGVGLAARRLPRLNALVVLVPTLLVVEALILANGENSVFVGLWAGLGFAFTFMISRLARVSEEQNSRERALIEEEKRSLAAQTEAAALAERGRIAREMHDVLAHSLSALAVELEGARLLARKHEAGRRRSATRISTGS